MATNNMNDFIMKVREECLDGIFEMLGILFGKRSDEK